MRNVIVSEFLPLDGVMADKFDELFASDALLLGRVTYQGFAAAWPSMTDAEGFAERMNSLPKYVVSTTLEEATWNNTKLIKGNVAEEVSQLKQQRGQDILISGSGKLIHTLMQHNLIDEYRLMVHPIIVGGGQRLFESGSDMAVLKLIDAKTFSSGIVLLQYQL